MIYSSRSGSRSFRFKNPKISPRSVVVVERMRLEITVTFPPAPPRPPRVLLLLFATFPRNVTSKQKVLLITLNDWKLFSCRRPGECSCSAVALILVAYANVQRFERFFRNIMLLGLPIIVYIITPVHVLPTVWWMTPTPTTELDSTKHCLKKKTKQITFLALQWTFVRNLNSLIFKEIFFN